MGRSLARLGGAVLAISLLGGGALAQEPPTVTKVDPAVVKLLQDAREELAEAAKELQASKPYQRYERAKRMVEGLQKLAAPKPEASGTK